MKSPIPSRGRIAIASLIVVCSGCAVGACASILGVDSDRSVAAQDSSTVVPDVGTDAGSRPDVVEAAADADAAMDDDGPWGCLNEPPEMFSAGAMTNVNIYAYDALQPCLTAQGVDGGSGLQPVQCTPLEGLQMRSCSSVLYPDCTGNTASPWEDSDDGGVFAFTLPQSFNGFFQIAGTESGSGLFTPVFFPGQFLAGADTTPLPGAFLTTAAAMGLVVVLPTLPVSFDQDGGVGHLILAIYDCNDHSAGGVYLVPSAMTPADAGYPTTSFYTQGNGIQEVPSTSATETDPSGAAGIMNVPIGAVTVRAYLKSTNQLVTTVNAFVNPGVASSVIIRARTH